MPELDSLEAYARSLAHELHDTNVDDRGLVSMTPDLRDAIVAGLLRRADFTPIRYVPRPESDLDPESLAVFTKV